LLKAINWQCFKQKDGLKGFGLLNQQSPLTMRFQQAELTILIQSPKEEELHQKGNLVQDLAQKCNPIKEPSHRGFDGRLQDYE
jgi:hypothetical protein